MESEGGERPPDKPDLRFVAVTGWLRSGTTLLAEILGSTPGSVALGELHHCWRAWALNAPCSCGSPARECEVWGAAMDSALPGLDASYANRLEELGWRLTRNRNTASLALSRTSTDLKEYLAAIKPVLENVAVNAKATTLIDTSKSGSSLLLMSLLAPARFDVVHLVRDVRGVAWSQKQNMGEIWKAAGDSLPPPTRSFARTAAEWFVGNLALSYAGHRVGQYVGVSYEALLRSPQAHLDAICALCGLDSSTLDWESDPVAIVLRGQHIINGNIARLGARRRVLKLDDRWRKDMPQHARVALGGVATIGDQLLRPSRSLRLQ